MTYIPIFFNMIKTIIKKEENKEGRTEGKQRKQEGRVS
jgi:hypothetical protein